MGSDLDELQHIVERADMPDAWKNILGSAIHELGRRSDTVLAEIRERVLREDCNLRADWNEGWNVVTVLAAAGREMNFEPQGNGRGRFVV